MKIKHFISFILFAASLLAGCKEKITIDKPTPEESHVSSVDDLTPRVTIEEFKEISNSKTEWFRLTGEIVSIGNSGYGHGIIYITDNTGYLLVFSLAESEFGSSLELEDFQRLGIKAGDTISIVAHKKTHNKVIEADSAYLERKGEGSYSGYSDAKAKASWLELPKTSGEDQYDYICHLNKNGKRNYSIYYDKTARIAKWVAYSFNLEDRNITGRSEAYAFDPLIGIVDQPDLCFSYKENSIGEDKYIRGHLVPSYDRSGKDNLDVFLATNIIPQSESLNNGAWGVLEKNVRTLSNHCDTLYIVIGTDYNESSLKVKDNRGLDIFVPDNVFKAVLAFSKDFGYKCIGYCFNNRASDAKVEFKSRCMSVDELEKKLGIDLFVNLPDDIEKEVEAQDPVKDSWWWQGH